MKNESGYGLELQRQEAGQRQPEEGAPLQIDHRIAIGTPELVGLAFGLSAKLAVDVDALLPRALRVVVADVSALDVALDGAVNHILNAAMTPIEAGEGRERTDALLAEVFVQKILAVDIGDID